MRARKYTDRIEVHKSTTVPDGFGGSTVTFEKEYDSWCNVKTLNIQRVTDLGLNENNTVIEVNLRYRDDVNYDIKTTKLIYRGIDFNILRVEKVNIENIEVKITAATNEV